MVISGKNFLNQLEEVKMRKARTILPAAFNCLALLVIFPISISVVFSIKFWIVVGLMAAAVTAARGESD
jgi:hypothetical protein